MLVVRNPGFASVQILYLQLVLRIELLELGEQVCLHEGLNRFGCLGRDKASGSSAPQQDYPY